MTRRSKRQRWAALVALALLATATFAAAPGSAAHLAAQDHGRPGDHPSSSGSGDSGEGDGAQSYQGVVQSVSARTIVAKALDGSVVSVPTDGRTRYFVGGRPASLTEIKPGFVVTASWRSGHAAAEVQAVDPSPQSGTSVAIVASVGGDRIYVTAPDGSTATIRVSGSSRVSIDGKTARLRDVKPGYALVGERTGTSGGSRAAGELRFLKR